MSRRNAILWGVGLTVIGMLTWIGSLKTTAPIRYVRIEGQVRHVTGDALKQALTPLLAGGYWKLDVDDAVTAVEKLAWVEKVQVMRIWPDVIRLKIQEQVPYVRWGKTELLNRRGEKFVPTTIEEYTDLPMLRGPEGYEKRLFSAYREMIRSLGALSFRILGIEVDARRSWQLAMTSAGGSQSAPATRTMVVLGRQQPQAAFGKVVRLLARLTPEQRQNVKRLDARYEHGFAVRWREQDKQS
ncbi:MAG: cell division protein FtsQ/DivIB [Methylohalobius crimeensis]